MKMFKRNQTGKPIFWSVEIDEILMVLNVSHGIVGGTVNTKSVSPTKPDHKSLMTKYNRLIADKRKVGYKEFDELYDDTPDIRTLSDSQLIKYLNAYLPNDNTGDNGHNLVMLAKTFKPDKISYPRIAQPKINGYRCRMKPVVIDKGLFGKAYGVELYSREGNRFSCPSMEQYIAGHIGDTTIQIMIDQGFEFDGELYVPFATVHQIKTYVSEDSHLLQYWIYDLIVEETNQANRLSDLHQMLDYLVMDMKQLSTIHVANNPHVCRDIVVIPHRWIENDKQALLMRDAYISLGFEGAILRHPEMSYQFGKRNDSMYKYKTIMDGYFKVLDIIPEGDARPDLPKFVCQNDLNDKTFEVTIYGTFKEQNHYLVNKHQYIGKELLVEYRERTDYNVPFHAKAVKFK